MNVQEAVDCTELSFEKAWEYCVPAILLIDGMLGQTTEGVVLPEKKTELPPPKYAVPTGPGKQGAEDIPALQRELPGPLRRGRHGGLPGG